jgi:FkbM family methyltransferase
MIPRKDIPGTVLEKVLGEVHWAERLLNEGQIGKSAYYDRLTELVMKRVLTPDSVCIDVGCCKGSILRLLMMYAWKGTFLAFEPIPQLYEELLTNFKFDNVHIYNVALSDSTGTSSFNYVITNPAYSGLKKRDYYRPDEEDIQIEVKTDSLDNILARERIGKVSFIKIDVEGAEYLVLKGAERCIKTDRPIIVFEHGIGASDYYGHGPEDVFDLLCDKSGLRISLLADWLLRKPSLDLRAFCDQYYSCKNHCFIAHG